MIFELWDAQSGNMLGAFATETAALEIVHNTVKANGAVAISEWVLGREDEAGDSMVIAEGSDLMYYAEKTLAH